MKLAERLSCRGDPGRTHRRNCSDLRARSSPKAVYPRASSAANKNRAGSSPRGSEIPSFRFPEPSYSISAKSPVYISDVLWVINTVAAPLVTLSTIPSPSISRGKSLPS
jgi:hypothetical protein